MLSSVVIEVEADEGVRGDVPGFIAHAWFLDMVRRHDSSLATALHANARHKPFTVSRVCFDGNGRHAAGRLRLTGLSAPVSSILQALTPQSIGLMRLGACAVRPRRILVDSTESPFAWNEPIQVFWERASAPQGERGVRLMFGSATAFASSMKNMHALFPEPTRVFASLASAWNTHAPLALRVSEADFGVLASGLVVDRYQLETMSVTLAHQTTRGFTGTCDYSVIDAMPESHVRLMHRLAAFAPFAGVGIRTTQGMGQTFAQPVPHFSKGRGLPATKATRPLAQPA